MAIWSLQAESRPAKAMTTKRETVYQAARHDDDDGQTNTNTHERQASAGRDVNASFAAETTRRLKFGGANLADIWATSPTS